MAETPRPGGESFIAQKPTLVDFTQAPDYAAKKAAALIALEPASPVNSKQRFATRETSYTNPDKFPGVVRFRSEDGEVYDPGLINEATTVVASREHLLLGGQIKELTKDRDAVGKRLKDEAELGWRGTEFDDLGGVGRSLSAIPKPAAKITDPEEFRQLMGQDFPKVAERSITVKIKIQEGHQTRAGVMSPEVIREIIETVLEKHRISKELQEVLVEWGDPETLITDLDVLRALIKADRVPLDTLKVERPFTLTPDVLPKDRSPRPQPPTDSEPAV